ncbi:MAG TPA: 50S ribosomal protein L25 [Phycisphaerae bacterium]|nr:50S ribosomal protein L25 [Phycisphaerae bacterium]
MALLKLNKRDRTGTRASRRLRGQGLVPAIIYGHGEANVAVSLSAHDIDLAVQHGEQLMQADMDGSQENFLIKEVQYDYTGQHIVHVDLTRVSLDERVTVTVPVVLRGTPVGVETEEGVLTQHLDELECECLVTEIPEEIRVPVNDLHVDDVLRVADLKLPEGLLVKIDPETPVASVSVVIEEEAAPAVEAEEAEPEVIGEKKEEEEAGEEKGG